MMDKHVLLYKKLRQESIDFTSIFCSFKIHTYLYGCEIILVIITFFIRAENYFIYSIG